MTDFSSPTWGSVVTYANDRIDALRKQNDNLELDIIATTKIRAEIRALKELLAQPERAARAKQQTSQGSPDGY